MLLFYGSQTGTAEDLGTRFAKEMTTALGIPTLICDIEDYDLESLADLKPPSLPRSPTPTNSLSAPQSADLKAFNLQDSTSQVLVGFFLATYGEGEPTDNAADFYEWIMGPENRNPEEDLVLDDSNSGTLVNLRYFVFGLGNRTYQHFNSMARRVDERFSKWGHGIRIGSRGEGDDDVR